VIVPKDGGIREMPHEPSSELIIEWRALTVILLDRVHEEIMGRRGMDSSSFPLVKMLEAGTWKAGRIVAKERREDGTPPIKIISDGTVF